MRNAGKMTGEYYSRLNKAIRYDLSDDLLGNRSNAPRVDAEPFSFSVGLAGDRDCWYNRK